MSRLTDLIRKAKSEDPQLGADLEREFRALSSRLSFGLNFERHRPEAVELPNRPVRKGDKVRVLPPRGSTTKGDQRLWEVKAIRKRKNEADLELPNSEETEAQTVALDDLIVIAEFGDTIYPGLVSTGKVSRGDDKPWHTVINGENYHALKALTWTHRGKVDAIYIDPPYNTRDKDWKYNNDYVDKEDAYRHSKWLAMMERRLRVAKQLLNPDDSVLIVTIDEKEYLRLGLLLEQVFEEAEIQMVSSVIAPQGSSRGSQFKRSDEFIFFVFFGQCEVTPLRLDKEWSSGQESKTVRGAIHWASLKRTGTEATRRDRAQMFYPIFLSEDCSRFHSVGEGLPIDTDRNTIEIPNDCVAVWPIRRDGSEGRWQIAAQSLRDLISAGHARLGRPKGADTGIAYLKAGERNKVLTGEYKVVGNAPDGSILTEGVNGTDQLAEYRPTTVWNVASHSAGHHGSNLLRHIIPGRKFPFPKSLYAVEDALRFFVKGKPDAIILDFFSGSGTTAHAVMRLNEQDAGKRQCISVTNNEVGADEQKRLREESLRPGDDDWEKYGICDYITKPRVETAITGKTPEGKPVAASYQFGNAVEKEESRNFKHIGFTEANLFNTSTKKKQLVALVDALPQSLVKGDCPFIVSEEHTSSVLFDLEFKQAWLEALDGQEQITDFYIVAPAKRTFDELKLAVSDLLGPFLLKEEQEVPMSDGFKENAEFFTLTYETPLSVSYQTAFARIAPLLWLRAGSMGRRIDKLPSDGWDVADAYGLLIELDLATDFLKALRKAKDLQVAYIVTDDERRFQSIARRLPDGVEEVRLYESYLTNFAFANGDDA
ncbi:MAG: DNA methyltransferase [Verrucomicrobiota bacterium]